MRWRQRWSTAIGLNYCQKDDGSGREKPYVQLSWLTKTGKRRGASYSVEKWGLRRALWNACVRLKREREKQGQEMPEPHEMFKTAHENILKQREEMAEANENEQNVIAAE